MLIMNQTRDVLLNLDNATSIELTITGDGTFNEIWAEVIDGAPVTLGEYITEEMQKLSAHPEDGVWALCDCVNYLYNEIQKLKGE